MRRLLQAVLCVSAGLALPAWAQSVDVPTVSYHMKWAEERWSKTPQGADWLSEFKASLDLDTLRAQLPVAANTPAQTPPRFDDPASIFELVLRQAPDVSIVYPTETYFYYTFDLGERSVSGNIRLLDAHLGTIHIGYFEALERDGDLMHAKSFTAADGVDVKTLREGTFLVTFRGVSRIFVVPPALTQPSTRATRQTERVITGIVDESGYAFDMMFNDAVKAFYYVLREDRPMPDRLVPVTESNGELFVGQLSRFVFFFDAELGRKVLCGVRTRSIMDNNYFDGAFDQVPPRLGIRPMIVAAYPYTAMRGGIDEHGNFLDVEGQRVAISPYMNYSSLLDAVDHLTKAKEQSAGKSRDEFLLALTYEPKRDFHKQVIESSGQPGSDMPIFYRQGWPANHTVTPSRTWPAEHVREQSLGWPRDHDGAKSSAAKPNPPVATMPADGE